MKSKTGHSNVKHTCYEPPANRLLAGTRMPKKFNRCWICGRSTSGDLREDLYRCCDGNLARTSTTMQNLTKNKENCIPLLALKLLSQLFYAPRVFGRTDGGHS